MVSSNTPTETFKAEIVSLGRITIPKTVRDILGIEHGDIVEVTIQKVTFNSQSPLATPGPHEGRPLQDAPIEVPVKPEGGDSIE